MVIKEEVNIHSWDNGKWVINSPDDRNFLVNEATYNLFLILKKAPTLNEAHREFEKVFLVKSSFEEFREYLSKVIGGFGILTDDFDIKRPSLKSQYLKLKILLLNSKIAGFLAKPITFFYNPSFFWYALSSLSLFIIIFFINGFEKVELSNKQLSIAVGLFYLAMPIHELGHIAACKKFGLKHGGIGFGFYYVLPVMYADITNIWTVNKERRIIANMGGIFSEVLYASILLLWFLISKNPLFFVAGFSIAFMIVWEFNPFVRFDGYWILSDLLETPNLLKKSKQMINIIFKRIRERNRVFLEKSEVWLFSYGILNTSFFAFFMTFTVFTYWNYIILFPNLTIHILKKWFNGDFDFKNINRSYLFILTFYILLSKFFIQNISKISHSWFKKVD